MKNWIKVIFALNSKLDALTDSIDSQVDGLSKVTSGDTLELFNRIISLSDKKIRLINMRVLHDKMADLLNERERFIISQSAKGKSLAEVAEELDLSRSRVYKIYDKATARLIRLLASHGYNEQKFADDYGDVTLVIKTYKKLARVAG